MTSKFTSRVTSVFLILVLFALFFRTSASAQYKPPQGTSNTEVSAQIGEFFLNISGWIAPYASVVLTTKDGVFMRSTVADSKGNFYISGVLLNSGFSGFCLTAIDYKRLGESVTCIEIPPAQASVTKTGIFLPPTLGFYRTEVAQGQEVFAFGQTMPKARVTIRLDNGEEYSTTADKEGFYKITIKNLKSGNYNVWAIANYEEKDSLTPTKLHKIKVLSLPEQFLVFLNHLWAEFINLLTSWGLGPLWLAIPIIILIIILLRKLYPKLFTSIADKLVFIMPKFSKKKKLHHWWWMGY